MKLHPLPLLLLAGSLLHASPLPPTLPVADELVLFASGNPQPWETRTSGTNGGKCTRLEDHARLHIVATRTNSGGGISLPTFRRFNPQAYLSDPCLRFEARLHGIGENHPNTLQVQLLTRDKQRILSEPLPWSEAAPDSDGWKTFSFAFPATDPVAENDLLASATVLSDQPCEFQLDHLSLKRYRNVSVHVRNPPEEAMRCLRLEGHTLTPSTRVHLVLTDAKGKKHSQSVVSQQGSFSVVWNNPPLSLQAHNSLQAQLVPTDTPMDSSLPQPLFGYAPNTDHLWLSVEGKSIVTSDLAAGGKQPFIPVGVGYARNVIIPAQDEAVAAFCKAQHLNTIRLPFYTRFFNNREAEPIDLEYHLRTFVDPVIQAAKRHGLYVLLDEHGYFSSKIDEAKARQSQAGSRWSEEGVAEWAKRWGKVAEYYKNEPYILGYELCNEPHDIDPETTRKWYGEAIREIRAVDPRHILVVGTCDWSHARAMEKTWGGFTHTVDAPYNNIVFAFHEYPTDNHPWQVKPILRKFRDTYNVPVLCTEFGAAWWDHDETTCRDFEAGLLALFAKEDIGWMVWALKKLENNPRAPHPPTKKVQATLPQTDTPPSFDSCAYSDIWSPIAHIMGSPFPTAQ